MKMGAKTVTGNLAADPEWRVNPQTNDRFLTMRLLETARVQNRESRQWEDGETIGYSIAVRDERMAQHIANSAVKGDRLTATGSYQVDPYVSKDGTAMMNHRIYANDVAMSLKFTDANLPGREADVAKSMSAEQVAPAHEHAVHHVPSNSAFPAPATPNPKAGDAPPRDSENWGRMMADKFQTPSTSQHSSPTY